MTIADLPIAAGFPTSASRETNWFLEDRATNTFDGVNSENGFELAWVTNILTPTLTLDFENSVFSTRTTTLDDDGNPTYIIFGSGTSNSFTLDESRNSLTLTV